MTSSKKKTSKIVPVAIVFLILGLLFIFGNLLLPETSYLNKNNILVEPYFFMIPLGYLFLLGSIILGTLAFVKNMIGKNQ
ncbi:DUF3955 domain-containing protein [Vagococcus sp.]|uniref:DUF3955 domain-containing protein n=1 Tax=Vagococcus sp. TaxID=1933889 RepID=UPI003F992A39